MAPRNKPTASPADDDGWATSEAEARHSARLAEDLERYGVTTAGDLHRAQAREERERRRQQGLAGRLTARALETADKLLRRQTPPPPPDPWDLFEQHEWHEYKATAARLQGLIDEVNARISGAVAARAEDDKDSRARRLLSDDSINTYAAMRKNPAPSIEPLLRERADAVRALELHKATEKAVIRGIAQRVAPEIAPQYRQALQRMADALVSYAAAAGAVRGMIRRADDTGLGISRLLGPHQPPEGLCGDRFDLADRDSQASNWLRELAEEMGIRPGR